MRPSLRTAPLAAPLLATLACQPPAIPSDEGGSETSTGQTAPTSDSASTTMMPGDGDGDGTDTDTSTAPVEPDGCVEKLDVLMVVDNSGSMGPVQARLANSLSALLQPLDDNGVDWRVGVTTSDNGNPWCPAGQTTPEGGKLVARSCRERLGDFQFNNGDIDASNEACLDVCGLESLDFLPTTTEVDAAPAPRPWLESSGGQLNLAEGTAEQALPCLIPQGINGCGFESQLESSYLALVRTQSQEEQSYGFVRSDASLLVLVVTDEVDCSYNKEWSEIFAADGNKVFWSDPSSAFPSSAVCWNAGVSCTGDPSGYDACEAVNKDANGAEQVNDVDAVLHPVDRYQGLLAGLQADKQSIAPGASVRLAVIGGTLEDGSIVYADGLDPQQLDNFGIGPGCTDGEVTGLPPVRMRDVALDSGGLLSSACNLDYRPNLAAALAPFIGECG